MKSEFVDEGRNGALVESLQLQSDQHPTVGCAVIAVMEEAYVAALADTRQEIEQGARSFRKPEAIEPLASKPRVPTDHVPDMQFGCVVVGHVEYLEASIVQACQHPFAPFPTAGDLHPCEHFGRIRTAVAVIELGDAASAE